MKLLYISFLCFLIAGCVSNKSFDAERVLSKDLALKILKNPKNTTEAAALAINTLKGEDLSSSFWVSLANNNEYSDDVRSMFIYEVFHEFVHRGMTLNDVASLLGPNSWIKTDNIVKMVWRSGLYPVSADSGDTAYVITVFPGDSSPHVVIYLTFAKEVSQNVIYSGLSGVATKEGSDTSIKEIGVSALRGNLLQLRTLPRAN